MCNQIRAIIYKFGTPSFYIIVVETRLDTAKGDGGGEGEGDVGGGGAHDADTKSNA